jgi:hypothetical protein
LIRQKGTLVDKNNIPLEDRITKINKQIKALKNKKGKKEQDTVNKLEAQLKDLYDGSRYLIDLRNKIFLFLDSPNDEMFEILKPIMSHDSWEIKHPYPYYVENVGYTVKNIITIGWPAFIFCSAKDESEWEHWPEIESRCMIVSPTMIDKKYHEATKLSGKKNGGLPKHIQKILIKSDPQIKLAAKCIEYIKYSIQSVDLNNIDVWSPYLQILSEILESKEGRHMRVANRIFNFSRVIPLTKIHHRDRLLLCDDDPEKSESIPSTSIIAQPEDLEEVHSITQNISGIPPIKLDEFVKVFIQHSKIKIVKRHMTLIVTVSLKK